MQQSFHPRKRTTHRNGWTPERRARQAMAIRRWRPWARSTGPRTAAGKAAIRDNARKHGFRSAAGRELMGALAQQKKFVQAVNRALDLLRLADKYKNCADKLLDCQNPLERQALADKMTHLQNRLSALRRNASGNQAFDAAQLARTIAAPYNSAPIS